MNILAVDQGTTSTRAISITPQGDAKIILALRHAQHYPVVGWVEHDPLELLANVKRCMESVDRADAIGIANQGESCLAWDAQSLEPLSPVIVWQDNRTTLQIEQLRVDGVEELTRERCGLPLDAYFSASKLGWIVKHLPEAQRARKAGRLRLGTTDAWFLNRLTGIFATDVTTASRTSLMNLRLRTWDPELCRIFGVPIDSLPEIRSTVGDFGNYRGIPLTASLVDQQASLYGHGCRLPGEAKITFGTGAFALALSGEKIACANEYGLTATVAWEFEGIPNYAVEGGLYDAGASIEWAHRLGLFSKLEQLNHFPEPTAIDQQLVFVPGLSGLACPHWDRTGAALWLGMTSATTSEQLCQALVEGVALGIADVIDAMDRYLAVTDSLSVDGGLTRNPYFIQYLADILQRKIVRLTFDELSAYGCAALAAMGIGYYLPAVNQETNNFTPRITDDVAQQRRAKFRDAVTRARSWRSYS
jgi:glycerol kinase